MLCFVIDWSDVPFMRSLDYPAEMRVSLAATLTFHPSDGG